MGTFAIVTGASAGLGKEFAKLFAAEGHGLVLVARRRAELEALKSELEAAHKVDVTVIACDLGDPAAPRQIEETLKDHDVEFLVNNAGFGSNGNFWELDEARELGMVALNVTALVALTRVFLPAMVAKKRGRILNIGSTAGFQPGPFMATYYATKAFVNSFTEALAFELKGTGVTATVSCPGATATEFSATSGIEGSALFKAGVATAESVALSAYQAMKAGKPRVVHGFKNKAGVQALRLSPRSAVVAIAANLNRPTRG